jgi:hypothetical protein
MKRSTFLLIAGALGCLFGAGMILAPAQMMASMTNATSGEGALVLRWMGGGLIAIGMIDILARNDPGSQALRAILIGNLAMHVIELVFDFLDFQAGFVRVPGVTSGAVVHVGIIIGCLVYLKGAGPQPAAAVGGRAAAAAV